ncbi:MAG TPA: endonuclease/exonuclease/phosphatase family protein [Thermoanaerobaculia bacterium]|nr:endonuclease/exonuclease/phosphatase family protein [Thermoanaerobaculia bacterium]
MRIVKRTLLVVGLLVVLVVSYRVLGVYEFRSGECTALQPRRFASTYPKRLVVMSFNIQGHSTLVKGEEHIAEVAQTILKYRPDVVGINEAHRGTWQARFGDHIAQLERLTGMRAAFGRSYRFAGGDFGNAVLTRGQIVNADVKALPGTGEPRTLFETIVRVNGGTIQFYVAHTAAWASINQAARGEQLQCINAHLQASGYPFILTGDLNAPPESGELRRFLDRNVLQFAGNPKESTHRVMGQRLDYILADPGWTVRSARVLDDGPSDHRPVLAELVHE